MKNIYNKHKEIILYIIMGIGTTLVSWVSFAVLQKLLHWSVNVSNLTSWVLAVLFAYITNKIWVFNSKVWKPAFLLKEFSLFVSARILTGIIEIAGVPLLIRLGMNQSMFGIEGMWAKVFISVIVQIGNYVFSKWIIFRKPRT